MTTRNPRVNVTLDEDTLKILGILAKKNHTSVSSITKSLIEEALEINEDLFFSKLVDSMEIDESTLVSEEDAWK
ncbi:MAG TPA: hypothetical protein VNJ29_01415 [Candidatus Nitrosotenuis sp.]|jgi:hypothetical protein|nr:hypothetical protein [Candidatus Nitrosotenuis sp.]